MEKLTRAAKFSDLREQINNDKETSYSTQDLSAYQNRFNNVQETLNPTPVEQNNKQDFAWSPFSQEPMQYAQPQVQQPQSYVQPEPVVQQPQSYVQPEPVVQQPVYQQPQYNQPQQYVQPQVQQPQSYVQPEPVVQQPVYQQPEVKNNSYYDNFMNTPVQNTNTVSNDFSAMFNNTNNNNANFVQQQRETYLSQTFSDVNIHNIANGQPTLNQIVNDTVNEVRHNDTVSNTTSFGAYKQEPIIDNTYAWNQPLDADKFNKPQQNMTDEQFSNTVSMEISKIMDGIDTNANNNVNANPYVAQPQPQVVNQPKVEQTQTFVQPQPQVVENKVEQPVEIKNISEMAPQEAMSETIPFVVSANDDEEIIEDDEEGSNTVLNIILIVLIIVLIAVLGLIVFYILKTKGIL